MISKQLVLTYLYLLIYVCLSSGVILFNKVGLSSSQCGVYSCLCLPCGRVSVKQGRILCVLGGVTFEEDDAVLLQ